MGRFVQARGVSGKRVFVLSHDMARMRAADAIRDAKAGYSVVIAPPTRTLAQNSKQWPILEAFAQQRQWAVNGRLEWITAHEWKDVLTAAFLNETIRLAAGLRGGVVMLGAKTSGFEKERFSEWIDFLQAVAVELGVEVD